MTFKLFLVSSEHERFPSWQREPHFVTSAVVVTATLDLRQSQRRNRIDDFYCLSSNLFPLFCSMFYIFCSTNYHLVFKKECDCGPLITSEHFCV